jgi:hypothetical protein
MEIANGLTREGVENLFSRRTIALHIRGFLDRTFCERFGDWASTRCSRDNYSFFSSEGGLQMSTTDRVGPSMNSLFSALLQFGVNSSEFESGVEIQSREARGEISSFGAQFGSRWTPIRYVLESLGRLWPNGSQLFELGPYRAPCGIVRIDRRADDVGNWSDPHVDWLSPKIRRFNEQFSAIVYLRMPNTGGELEIWDVSKYTVISLLRENGTISRLELPQPIRMAPNNGDLIIINTRRPHAVQSFHSGRRIVHASFIGVNPGAPLQFWS